MSNVLVACEESQVVAKAFFNLGFNAFSADIQDCSGGRPDLHVKGDVLNLLGTQLHFNTVDNKTHYVDKWDLIIAHPPCTFLTKAGACKIPSDPKRIEKGFLAAEFFYKFYNFDCPHIAIENPVPMARFNLPAYSQIIQPYDFGSPYSKKTCLWLKNLPPLFSTCIFANYESYCSVYKDSKIRSKTFPGIALAMAEQWQYFI